MASAKTKRRYRIGCGIAVLSIVALIAINFVRDLGADTLVIDNATIIDVTAASSDLARKPNQRVVIKGDRIVGVGNRDQVSAPFGAQRVDASGKFIVPGYWDMHSHLKYPGNDAEKCILPLMFANGISGMRDMCSDLDKPDRTYAEIRGIQTAVEKGKLLGPRVLALCRRVGEKQNASFFEWTTLAPRTREDGHAVALAAKRAGFDFIKTYSFMPREAFFGLMERANEIGIPVAGHIPSGVTPTEASNAGMLTFEHARYPAYACSPDYERWRAEAEELNRGERDDPATIYPEAYGFDEKICEEIVSIMAENGTYLCPTHTTKKVRALATNPSFRDDERLKFVRPTRNKVWQENLASKINVPPKVVDYHKRHYEYGLRATGIAHANGVKILAGSDVYSTYVFPGFSFHDELANLHDAGLSPFEILKAATINGAECLEMTRDFGSVEVGKMADLVILNKDPLVDIRNSSEIHQFVYDGKLYDRAFLDRKIARVIKYVEANRAYREKEAERKAEEVAEQREVGA